MNHEPQLRVMRERVEIPHALPVNPTCGYALAGLLEVRAPEDSPRDFEAFWRETYAQARAEEGRLDIARRPASQTLDGVRVSELEFTSWEGARIGAWLVEPPEGHPPRGLLVVGHGYGGREGPEYGWSREGYAALYPCARGFNRSAHPDFPSESTTHVLHRLEQRERYVIRGCVAELWHAASVLIRLYPALEEHLFYAGVSFGGGLGALLLPWDRRFKRAHLSVPTFGNHPLRLRWPCTGAGESARKYAEQHPEAAGVLRYYDAATAATFVRIPTLTHAALFDPAVIPPGQFAVANSLRAPGSKLVVIPTAHFDPQPPLLSPQENEQLNREVVAFIKGE